MQNLLQLRLALATILVFFIGTCYATTFPSPQGNARAGINATAGYLVDDSEGEPLVDLNGTPWRFESYKGRWIVVSYWASYCPPCLAMVPELNAIYRGREGKQAMVLGVNYDFVSNAEVNALVKEFNITYPVTQGDPSAKLGVSTVDVLPMTVLINPEGEVTQYLKGAQTQVSLENYMRPLEENATD